MNRSYSLAAELARVVTGGEASAVKLDTLASLINGPSPDAAAPEPTPVLKDNEPPDQYDRIGIWSLKQQEGMDLYVRDTRFAADWRLWANQHVIFPKKGKRVVLLGESVARGYFYDPFFNPAIELRSRLQAVEGFTDFEVVDLAKSGLTLEELSRLSESCLRLDPDLIIIFAGNNWAYSLYDSPVFSEYEIQSLTNALHSLDLMQVKEKLDDKLAELVKNYMATMASFSARHGIPVLFIIPEYNLDSWKSTPLEKIVAGLPEDNTDKWIAAGKRAKRYLQSGRLPDAQKESEQMIALDPTNPLGYEYLAECHLRNEKYEEARHLLESARDTSIVKRLTNHTPRCFSSCRRTILEQSKLYGFHVVDLPAVFKDHLGGKIPGRDLFLDYCHLNHEGIKLAMDAAFDVLLPLFDGKKTDVKSSSARELSTDLVALAHLLAATLNSRFGQPREILNYHCMQAVKISRISARFMTLFSSLACRKASTALCKSYGQILAEGLADQYNKGTGLLHAENAKTLDYELIHAMIAALQTVGIDIHGQIEVLLNREHGVKNAPVNLLESFYHMFSIQKVAGASSCYYKAYDITSEFLFFMERNVPVYADITWRIPATENGGKARLLLNDAPIDEMDVGNKWQTKKVLFPSAGLIKGANRLLIKWPAGSRVPRKKAEDRNGLSAAGSLDRSIGSLYHTFGEIHTLMISAVQE
ncbi:hypothetical protein Q4E93_32905 [Flavitalea sp. BT771]|uniref:tetratricopeptide repeat protein n=1 Tax=Flavitalea sp. BT771 TaxID=3063329 RepID=UPI0026E4674C|nr:tetratricopeptide repeat protein [Flavitalea sp. BT771]MDO6435460.1 hypothetical protein [Flavitalea sp. BT771]MDV6224360.1 hypothetical protein [Flavitalea sp. BT771]